MQIDCRKCGAHIPRISTLAQHVEHEQTCHILAPLMTEALAGLSLGGRACLTTMRRTPMVRPVDEIPLDHPAWGHLLRDVFGADGHGEVA